MSIFDFLFILFYSLSLKSHPHKLHCHKSCLITSFATSEIIQIFFNVFIALSVIKKKFQYFLSFDPKTELEVGRPNSSHD